VRNIAAKIQSVDDALYYARKRVPRSLMDVFEAGSGAGVTARRNEEAFRSIEFLPRSAIFHPSRNLQTTVLGHEISMPVLLSSVGALRAGHVDGDLGVTRAAGAANTIQIVSGVGTTAIHEIAAEAQGPIFQQLYFVGDRDMTAGVIERAKAAGVAALVVIADSAAPNPGLDIPASRRARIPRGVNLREAIRFAPQLVSKIPWTADFVRNGLREPCAEIVLRPDGTPLRWMEGSANIYSWTPDWSDLNWIREIWDGPIVMKGIVTVESAKRAVDEGIDAIVVSNHGGNMLDGTVPSIEALPRVVDAVGDSVEVLLDGGIRRGTDVVKALALGARAVSLGRSYVYPLLAAGEPGVRHILDLFYREIDGALAHLGVASVHDLDRSYLSIRWR